MECLGTLAKVLPSKRRSGPNGVPNQVNCLVVSLFFIDFQFPTLVLHWRTAYVLLQANTDCVTFIFYFI